ncbi:unnamed protein product [Ceratitis capitata]|uniref:(Mediterranean fruit fly) hypothetical protein n=1 Tax=Ceratitis capitata TaxID=7213 RepID=A0A811V983_CERCA|nr:unnamed protein product [Ceratitis capitata]
MNDNTALIMRASSITEALQLKQQRPKIIPITTTTAAAVFANIRNDKLPKAEKQQFTNNMATTTTIASGKKQQRLSHQFRYGDEAMLTATTTTTTTTITVKEEQQPARVSSKTRPPPAVRKEPQAFGLVWFGLVWLAEGPTKHRGHLDASDPAQALRQNGQLPFTGAWSTRCLQ